MICTSDRLGKHPSQDVHFVLKKEDINVGNMGRFVLDSYRKVKTKRGDEEPKDLLNFFFLFSCSSKMILHKTVSPIRSTGWGST